MITVKTSGAQIEADIDGKCDLVFTDGERPYICGSIGVSVGNGSHCEYGKIEVKREILNVRCFLKKRDCGTCTKCSQFFC